MQAARINLVKVFSATKAGERAQLGDRLSAWSESHPTIEILEVTVTQSSDSYFHCLAITVFAHQPVEAVE